MNSKFVNCINSAMAIVQKATSWFPAYQTTIDNANRCLFIKNITPNSDESVSNEPIPLESQERAHTAEGSACSYACYTVGDDDVNVNLDLKHAFENSIAQIREGL